MKVLVLGSGGMLGSVVFEYLLSNGVNVIEYNNRFELAAANSYVSDINILRPDYIINCVGAIPQKNNDFLSFYQTNSVLPSCLGLVNEAFVIQPSTDCVFSCELKTPKTLPSSNDIYTARDHYGVSKALGDSAIVSQVNGCVVRGSIVGFTKDKNSKGLFDWAYSMKGTVVNGYTNHFWNGVTTYSWIDWVYNNIIRCNENKPGLVYHLGCSLPKTKYEMLIALNEIAGLGLIIKKCEDNQIVDRRLKPDFVLDTFETMLAKLPFINMDV